MSNDDMISIVANNNTTVVDGNNSLIVAGNGNDTLTAGSTSIVTAGNGNDTITVGANSAIAAGNGNDTLTAGAGSIVIAGNGNDAITVGANSAITVGNGNDTLTAGSSSIVIAGNGNDTITVGANSAIAVGNGNDTLRAGANSVVIAGNGNDTIYLGASDTVTVGTGKDTFVLPGDGQVTLSAPQSLSVNEDGTIALAIAAVASGFGWGQENIFDFNASNDKIQLSSAQFANFAAVMAAAKQVGSNTVITADATDSIVLNNVKLSSLTAKDFAFTAAPALVYTISGIPAAATLTDTAGAIQVVNGTATLTQAQLAGLTLKAGEVTAANLVVTATDPTTGNSVSKIVALSVNPVAPTLHTPATLNVASGGTVALGITETPFDSRDVVSITISGVPADASLSAGTKNIDGSWSLMPTQLANLTLKAGAAATVSLTVTATNMLGQTASSPAAHIQLTIASPLSVTFDKVTFTDTGVQGDHLTDNSTVMLSGTVTDAIAVSKVNVYNAGSLIGSATINPDHTWTLTKALADGNYNQLSVTATDAAGTMASAATGQYVLIDTKAPTVISQSESNPGLTQSTTEVITVNASDANSVQSVAIYNDVTQQKVGDATLSNGVWTYTASGLADGTYKYCAVVTDNAGNQTTTADLTTVTVDTTAPKVISESESVSGPTQLTTDIIKVNASDLNGVASVAIYDHATNQKVGDASVGSDGAWAYTASNLTGGAHTFYAVVTDNAGNHTTTTDLATVTVDNTPPVISFGQVKLDNPDSTGTMSNDGGATLSGTVSDNVAVAQVQVFNGTTSLGMATVANGTWTLHTKLDVGSYDQLHATATDAAGNSADIASHSVVTITQVAGLATDGYISGATVFADTNGNGKLDTGEAYGTTDAGGHFVLGAGTTSGALVLTGGTDTATNQAFTGVLTAPTGSTQVTALTTLVQSVAVANGGDVAAASQAVAAALGIDPSIDLTKTDILTNAYAGNAQPFVAAAQVLNTVSMVASAVSGTGASNFTSAATGAFSALAAQIVSTGGLDLTSSSVVNAVVTSTLTSVSVDPANPITLSDTQTSDIASVVTSVNTATNQAVQAVQASPGGTTADLLASVSATSIVAQGSASADLAAGTQSGNLSSAVANNTSTALSNAVQSAASQVVTASLAPAAPNFVSLTPTDASPTAASAVHYLLTFSNSVKGVDASDFSLATNGLTGASITSVTAVAGSAGAQYLVEINPGSGNGTLSLNFAGTTVQDLTGVALQDQSVHTATSYSIDHSAGEQAALALAVTNTQVNAAGSAVMNFTISGLQPTDTGVVTFTDGQNSVSVNVNGGQSTYTANLSALSDGPISSQLAVNTNAAGHSFTPVAGSSAVTLTGFSTPPGGGISVVQNATGDIGVVSAVAITNQSGIGLLAQETASGIGNIVVNTTGSVTGTGSGSIGLEAQNLDASDGGNVSVTATGGVIGNQHAIVASTAGSGNASVETGGAITSAVQFGIRAAASGTGDVSVLTDAGSTINSGGAGISAINFDTVLAASANATVTVTNNAVINSGTTLNPSGSVPQGIAAGFYGANGTANTAINGTVLINNNANITAAAGYGIDAYNWGNGDVTLNEAANTAVSGAQYALAAYALSKGSGNVTVNVGANVALTATTYFGIQASVSGVGNISVQTGDGDTIYGGSIGVNAQSQATSDPVTGNINVVLGNDTIHSGTLNTPNTTPTATPGAVSVGYLPNGAQAASNAVLGNVTLQSDAQITADKNAGINAYNWGKGNVTVSTGIDSTIHAVGNGIQANALNGGNVSVTNGGSINSGATGITAGASMGLGTVGGTVTIVNNGTISAATTGIGVGGNHVGAISVTNNGTVTATQFAGIGITAVSGDATITNAGSTTGTNGIFAATNSAANVSITNQGTATGTSFSGISADLTAAGATGSISIANSSTVTSLGNGAAIGIKENVFGTVTINNTGIIGSDATKQAVYESGGDISLTNSGTITGNINVGNGTFNNQASGVWAVGTWSGFGTASTTSVVESNTINNAGSINLSAGANINGAHGLAVNNSGHIDNLAGTNVINGSVNNTGTLEVASGSLEIGGGLSGTGTVLVDANATLVLDGATAQTVTFTGSGGTFGLNSASSGTIAVVSSTGGNFMINGFGSVAAAVGDGIDFTATGGTPGNMAEVFVATGGAITGAANGIVVTQNGGGDIAVSASNAVTGQAGDGIDAQISASGTGNISVTATGGLSASGTTSVMTGNPLVQTTQGYAAIRAQNLDTANNGNVTVTTSGALTGSEFGIRAQTSGSGNVSVTTDATTLINAGGAGISVVNFDTSMLATANSTINVTAHGTINSGSMVNPNGSTPAGINVSYYGSPVGTITPVANANVNGTVLVTTDATIGAAGYGIQANNFGNGNITVNETGGSITAAGYGINAYSRGIGSVSISTSSGASITSSGTGINAANQAVFDASNNATVTVTNAANISAGAVPNGGTLAGILAGFSGTYGLVAASPNAGVNGTVLVNNSGNITSAAGYGIDAYNWGNGNVTVNDGAGTTVTGNLIGVGAFGLNGVAGHPGGTGNIAITVGANATITSGAGNDGIQAYSLDNGNVSVTTADSLTVNAGRYGIGAFGQSSTVSAGSTVSVVAGTGTIHAVGGGINAGYSPGSVGAIEPGVAGNVSVVSNATISVTGSNGFGISAFNWGTGDAAVTTGAASNVTATNGTGNAISASTNDGGNVTISNAGFATGGGNGINAFVAANAVHAGNISVTNTGTATGSSFSGVNANDAAGGNVSVTNGGSATGTSGINVNATGAGNIGINNQGTATGTTHSGISAYLAAAGATGSVSITNSGTVTSLASNSPAIGITENNIGTVTINNTGIIGSNASSQALFEGGGDITLTNSGTITGSINVGNGTFNNQATGVWAVGTWSGLGTASTTGVIESNTINNAGTINLSAGASINGASGLAVNNSGHIDSLSGTNMINGSVNNTGTLEVASGSLEIGGGLSGTGTVLVDAGATLILDGATAQTVTFTGSGGTLGLNVANSGPIVAVSSTGGNFTVNGVGTVGSTVGDGIDFTASGGTSGNMAKISVAPGGGVSGAVNGIVVTQNGTGDISVSTSGPIVGQAGTGILAQDTASGVGNIQVVSTGSVTGSGSGLFGIQAQNLNAANGGNVSVTSTGGVSGNQHAIVASTAGNGNVSVEAGGAIVSTVQFGIRAGASGTGNVSVLTDAGSTINSGGAGISAINQATALAAGLNSSVTVTNNAVINSGTTVNPSGSVPQGIAAGYYGANGQANTNINGTVIINNNANITAAAGYGVDGYNYGNGNVTVNEAGNTSVTADQYGLAGYANSKGSGSVAINVGANVAVNATTYIGIQASTTGVGDINIQTGDGDTIYGGSIAVNAQSQATSEPATGNLMVVLGNDVIHSGTHITGNGGNTPGAVSVGYAPNGAGTLTNTVLGNVTVQSNAQITADSAVGINAYNWGKGNVTVSTGSASSITAPGNGIQASANNGGNITVTNGGSIHSGGTGITANASLGLGTTGGTIAITNNGAISAGNVGIFANGSHVGNISITNNGTVNGTSSNGIAVNLTASGSTGSTTITNTGVVTTSASAFSAISVSENATGTVTINNSGTIGSSAGAGAIFESGGSQITINNSGAILGGISTGTGVIGATTILNNNAGGVWQVSFLDDEGTINAAGAASAITIVGATNGANIGASGTGSMNLSAGAELTTDFLNIGNQLGSHGTVLVTGVGTSVNVTGQTPQLQVGSDGTATLTISDHATVTTTNMILAVNHDTGVTDTLTVDDASLHVGGVLTIGNAGAATALVENGGSLTAGTLFLAEMSGGAGSLTVDGAGSLVTASSISLGGSSAVLTLSNGGAIDIGSSATTIANTIHIGGDGSLVGSGEITSAVVNDGTITATVGTLQIDQQLTGTGSVNVNVGATLHLLNGAASSETIQFNVPSGSTASLVVDHAASLQASISGFTGNGQLSGSDQIDLKDINFGTMTESYDATNNILNISDGTNSAAIHFIGSYQQANFAFADAGTNGTIVYDPPVLGNTTAGSTNTAPVAEGDGFKFAAMNAPPSAGPWIGDAHNINASISQVLNSHVDAFATSAGQVLDAVIADNKLLPGHDYHVL